MKVQGDQVLGIKKNNMTMLILLGSMFTGSMIYGATASDIKHKDIASGLTSLKQQNLNSPAGYWLQYTDDGKKAQSILQVYQDENGKLEGKILVPFVNMVDDKVHAPDIACKKCGDVDENGYKAKYSQWPNNQVQGLKIMWSFTQDGEVDGSDGPLYDSGSILDPSSGKVYSCKIQTQDNGKKLYVRGYIGFSLFGRTQYWYRIDKTQAEKYIQMCGLTTNGHYAYADKNGKITNQALWQKCSHISL